MNNEQKSELREFTKNFKLIDGRKEGIGMFPKGFKMTLGHLLSEEDLDEFVASIEKIMIREQKVDGSTSDGYHTFDELYKFRMLYNALLFNEWEKHQTFEVSKSWRHSDGELCFGGGWFIVTAETDAGQITNHYQEEYWDLFNIPSLEWAPEWDGHTPQDVLERLNRLAALQAELGDVR